MRVAFALLAFAAAGCTPVKAVSGSEDEVQDQGDVDASTDTTDTGVNDGDTGGTVVEPGNDTGETDADADATNRT